MSVGLNLGLVSEVQTYCIALAVIGRSGWFHLRIDAVVLQLCDRQGFSALLGVWERLKVEGWEKQYVGPLSLNAIQALPVGLESAVGCSFGNCAVARGSQSAAFALVN